jgi:hypothetical protein
MWSNFQTDLMIPQKDERRERQTKLRQNQYLEVEVKRDTFMKFIKIRINSNYPVFKEQVIRTIDDI